MSTIYEVPDGDKDEHVYETPQPGTSSGNGDARGVNSNGTPKLFQRLVLSLLILLAVLISADISVSVYSLQTQEAEVGCKKQKVTSLIPGEMIKQSYKPREEIRGLTCAAGEQLVGDSSLVCQEDGTWRGSAACKPRELKSTSTIQLQHTSMKPDIQEGNCTHPRLKFDLHCYLFVNERRTFEQSAAYCRSQGAELVYIMDTEENDFVLDIVREAGAFDKDFGVWIGIKDYNTIGSMATWTVGKAVDFTKFADGEPNNRNSNEQCIEMRNGGYWNDNNCSAMWASVCKM